MSEEKYILFGGELIESKSAKIHVLSPSVTYAATVFEGIRAYWNSEREQLFLFRLNDHLRRLKFSMRVMRFGAEFSVEDMREQVLRLVRANDIRHDTHLRVMSIIEFESHPNVTTSAPVSLVIASGGYAPNKWVNHGMAVAVSSWNRVHDATTPPRVKATANYSNGRLAMMQAHLDGYDSVLMLTRDGKVSEGPVATVFLARRGLVSTPRITDGILESITRETLIQLFREQLHISVLERAIDRTELYDAEEIFFCGSAWEVTPVASVDRIETSAQSPGPITQRVRSIYLDVVTGRHEQYQDWLTPVW